MRDAHLSRRHFLAGTAAVATAGFPAIVRSQPKEVVIGGAASHKAFMDPTVIPMFEKKYDCKIIFEGTKSLVNLEKMVSNKSKPYLSVVMMDDPVLLLAVKEDVLEKTTAAKVPNRKNGTPAKRLRSATDLRSPFSSSRSQTSWPIPPSCDAATRP